MSGDDLIVLIPWVLFGAATALICARLLSARHPRRRGKGRDHGGASS